MENSINPAKPIQRVLLVIAMHAEAMPIVDVLKLTQADSAIFPKGVPWIRYTGSLEGLFDIDVVVPGKCPIFGVDNVGTVPLALATFAAIQALQPDLVINAGTAGGFKAKGACVGDVFLATQVAYHDRRIPIPIFDTYGIATTKCTPVPNMIAALGFKEGNLSTGNSLDMTQQDEQLIKSNDASIKDMEAKRSSSRVRDKSPVSSSDSSQVSH
ncbi:5'-methylthioadenosine/S-adenosylhomocysteine nucleosidase 2 isoform X2 [Selaginella moellendorffii]|uniref:5'-methylthioadenosine/S-adenosylhomocysteine nucleosidase 2 isoform X2 n=1 Tax=Selaginella moellendorffii TaxID=88036 RepID=UPI000D1C525B|nr:5'-methylthioadenosine/S-adenosylhomocysteine nucleosidase 2 isoform X2 [Selaginella moellendorffii]|eukprot:XP_024545373.1 5'-methylthioadenosine/S-adenosylhomocysteine nucleosidase 2 isoform X2 [Selaginella moellendorffii]